MSNQKTLANFKYRKIILTYYCVVSASSDFQVRRMRILVLKDKKATWETNISNHPTVGTRWAPTIVINEGVTPIK